MAVPLRRPWVRPKAKKSEKKESAPAPSSPALEEKTQSEFYNWRCVPAPKPEPVRFEKIECKPSGPLPEKELEQRAATAKEPPPTPLPPGYKINPPTPTPPKPPLDLLLPPLKEGVKIEPPDLYLPPPTEYKPPQPPPPHEPLPSAPLPEKEPSEKQEPSRKRRLKTPF